MSHNNSFTFEKSKEMAYEQETSLLNLILSFENDSVTYDAFDFIFDLVC